MALVANAKITYSIAGYFLKSSFGRRQALVSVARGEKLLEGVHFDKPHVGEHPCPDVAGAVI